MSADLSNFDLIRELRLRHWARKHYVAPEVRGRHWHPIVLEEMEFRDLELAEMRAATEVRYSPFVPLEPTDLRYLDGAHPAVPAPKLVNTAPSAFDWEMIEAHR